MTTKFVEKAKIKMFCVKTEKGYVKKRQNWNVGDPELDFFGSIKNAQFFFSIGDAKYFIETNLNFKFRGNPWTEAQRLGIENIEIHSVSVDLSDNGII